MKNRNAKNYLRLLIHTALKRITQRTAAADPFLKVSPVCHIFYQPIIVVCITIRLNQRRAIQRGTLLKCCQHLHIFLAEKVSALSHLLCNAFQIRIMNI